MRCVRSILYSIEKRGKGKGREFLYKDSKNYPSPPSPPSLGVEMVARTHRGSKMQDEVVEGGGAGEGPHSSGIEGRF